MITPMDIHNKQFTKATVRGYSEEEVNDFLNQIVADYERIYREHREMEEKLDQMKAKLANYEKISETMTATLQLAKDTAENVKKNARRNADILIANAKADSEKQIKDAQDYRRTLIHNMVLGVTEGFKKNLEVNGVGYRVQVQNNKLTMNLGFSHQVIMDAPEGITIECPSANAIVISGADKQAVGQFAAQVREKRPPEPYKGKGIKYDFEHIRRKEGKAGKK